METRCDWCVGDRLLEQYHDTEWGVPKFDTRQLFECLTLELMQTGLSWRTVLGKREAMRESFFDFDPVLLANQGHRCLPTWLQDARLIRHSGKLLAMINNAQIVARSGPAFSDDLWRAVGGTPVVNRYASIDEVPTQTELSRQVSLQLRKQGFRFIGPVTTQSFMQAVGMVNDHLLHCFRHPEHPL